MAIPIPHRLSGDPATQITIDAFIDIQCPYSQSICPTLIEV